MRQRRAQFAVGFWHPEYLFDYVTDTQHHSPIPSRHTPANRGHTPAEKEVNMAPKAKTGDAGGPSSRTKTKTEDAGGMSSTAKPATETYTLEPGETSVEDLLASPTFAGFAEHFHKEDLHDRPRLLRQLEAAQAAVPTKFGEDEPRRRSSAYSFVEANRDFREVIVDPGPKVEPGEISWKAWLPIAFAVIPPIAGLIFKNGSAFFSDLTLLGLASIFLHWSIVAPW